MLSKTLKKLRSNHSPLPLWQKMTKQKMNSKTQNLKESNQHEIQNHKSQND